MTTSIWKQDVAANFLHALHKNLQTEVCIVGGGISGLTAAYLLTKNNVLVTVVYDGPVVGGETSRSSAQLNTVHDDGWSEMLSLHGVEAMQLCSRAYREAVDFIKRIILKENIECNFEELPAYLWSTKDTGGAKWIDDELDAAQKCNVAGVSKVAKVPSVSFESGPALLYQNQAQFHPGKYLLGLLKVLEQSGVQVFPQTRVVQLETLESKDIRLVLQSGNFIDAKNVILASNVPFHHRVIPIEALESYRSYVITVPLRKGSHLENAQYWDNLDPYHYVRLLPSENTEEAPLLLIGGEDRRTGQIDEEKEKYEELLNWGKAHFPITGEIKDFWSAQTVETFDRMPLIGSGPGDPESLQMITGDSGTGLIHGTLGALITTDIILGRTNSYAEIFAASRGRTKSFKTWVSQNLKTVTEYRDWITGSDETSADHVKPGQGAIVREGIHKIAVYRDSNGTAHRFSAVCPHLGAILRWNEVEKTWDCPAHGSRFSCDGCALNGPTAAGLSKG